MREKILIFLILFIAFWCTGCATNSPDHPDTGNTVAADFFQHSHTVRSYTAEVTRTYAGIENDSEVFTINVKYPDKLRIDLKKSPRSGDGTVVVIRENQSFRYSPSANQVTEMSIDKQDWSNRTSWADDDYWRMAEVIASDSEITTKSCETTGGKTYCTVEMRPWNPNDFAGKYQSSYAYSDVLIRVDTSTLNPVKMQLFYDNDKNSVSVDYRNLTENSDLSDSLFTISIPAGVTVVTPPTHPPVHKYPDTGIRTSPVQGIGTMNASATPENSNVSRIVVNYTGVRVIGADDATERIDENQKKMIVDAALGDERVRALLQDEGVIEGVLYQCHPTPKNFSGPACAPALRILHENISWDFLVDEKSRTVIFVQHDLPRGALI